jgi:hypothetical protein
VDRLAAHDLYIRRQPGFRIDRYRINAFRASLAEIAAGSASENDCCHVASHAGTLPSLKITFGRTPNVFGQVREIIERLRASGKQQQAAHAVVKFGALGIKPVSHGL